MLMDNGDLCGTKLSRKTIISFKCSPSKSEKKISFLYEKDCVYYFEWWTEFACILDCSIEHKNNLYDLSRLIRPSGQFWPVFNLNDANSAQKVPYTNIILNVCENLDLNPDDPSVRLFHEKCSKKASVCAYDQKTGQVTNLGVFSQDLSVNNDSLTNNLRLIYKTDPTSNCSTVLNFICDLNIENYPNFNKPQLSFVSADRCLHEIYWRTSEACPKNRLVSSNECVIKSNERVIFDLNPLKSQTNTFFMATHNHDLDEDQDSSDFDFLSTEYKFHICGQRLNPNGEFTFMDDTSDEFKSFRFTNTPKLIYDEGLLYFKYENSSTNKYAFIKMECSYEESLGSNSQDYKLMKHLFQSLIQNLNLDQTNEMSPIAFILWKTKFACLSGSSNQLANHFKEFISYDDNDNHAKESTSSADPEKCIVYFDGPQSNKFIDLNAHDVNNYIDLRVFLKKHHADENDLSFKVKNLQFMNEKLLVSNSLDSIFKLHTRLCVPSLKCANSLGCLILENDHERSISLGNELDSTEYFQSDNRLVLNYINGDVCTPKLNFSFELTIKCWTKNQQLAFIRSSNSDCRFHFEWLTRSICPCELNANSDKCANSEMANFERNFHKLSNKVYNFTIEKSQLVQFSLNKNNLNYTNGFVSSTFVNIAEKCKNNMLNSTTRVEFYCDYNEERNQLDYLYSMKENCQHVVGFYSYLACPSYLTRENMDFKCGDLDSEKLVFKLRIQNYRMEFRICGLLPNVNENEVNSSYVEESNMYGDCFDKYGNLFLKISYR